MTRKLPLFYLLVGVVTFVVVIGGFVSFQRKRSSFERLDFQFHWVQGSIIVDGVDPGSGAEQSGLRKGDRIWLVAGVPSTEVEGLKKTLRRIGQPVPLLIARGNETLSLVYRAPDLKIDYRYLFLTFIGFLYLSIGLYTVFRDGGGDSSVFFLVTLLAFVVYVYTPAGRVDASYKILSLVEEFARVFLPPLALHFFLRFPRPLFQSRWAIRALYLLPALLFGWIVVLFSFEERFSGATLRSSLLLIDRWEMLHFAVYFTLALVALTYTYRTAPVAGEKKQIKWIYLGMAVGFVPFLILYLIPFILKGGSPIYTTMAILPLAFIPLAFAVSILKYKLWDVEVVIKEVLAYTVTFIFGMIAFSTVNLVLSRLLEERLALERNFLAFGSGLLIAVVLIPVKGKIETLVEMFLYRETYRHRRAISEFAQELGTIHDLHELIDLIRQRLLAAMGIERMNLLICEEESLILYSEDPGLPAIVSLSDVSVLAASRYFVLDEPRLPDVSEFPLTLLRSGYRYVFPLRHRGELQGLMICGTKHSHESLSRDDLHLVESLAAPVALSIENARLYGRLRRQLDQIRSLKEYNENIIESSSSAIVVISAEGTILTANHAFWDLVGTAPGHEGSIGELFPPYETMRSGRLDSIETSFVNSTGQQRELTIRASAFQASDAPAGATVLVIGDISERLRLERELQEKDRLAELGLLAAGVAHEVNTPLTGISSYAQLLLADTSPDDPRYALLKKVEQQTVRASQLVTNLLNLAAHRASVVERMNLGEVVRSSLSINEGLFDGKPVARHVDVPESIAVLGNQHELQQVLTNLILNALDAIAGPGNIWISAEVQGREAILRIRDDGRGIPPAILGRIFQPLFTTKRGQGGTGLGLSICEKLVNSFGGSMSARSVEGKGATFDVHLPLWEAE